MRKVASMVLLLSSCGADGGSGGPTTLTDYQLAVLSTFCDRDVRCGGLGASQKGLCLQLVQLELKGAVDYQALLDAKHIAFDAGKASVCLEAQRRVGCDFRVDPLGAAACRDSLRGLVPVGGACVATVECNGGWCDSATTGCAGKCVAWVPTGAACGGNNRCDPETDACEVNGSLTCKPFGKAGEPCTDSFYCADDLACVPGASPPARICAKPGTAGAPCAGSDACASGFYCDRISLKCKARVASGSTCDNPAACEDGLACVGFDVAVQSSTGTCRPWADAGGACTAGVATVITDCAQSLTCDAGTGKCVASGAPGAACVVDKDCTVTLCDTVANKCILPSGYGEACTPLPNGGHEPCVDGKCDPVAKICKIQCG